jgi:hypothetical protein
MSERFAGLAAARLIDWVSMICKAVMGFGMLMYIKEKDAAPRFMNEKR